MCTPIPSDLWSQSILPFISHQERLESLTLVSQTLQQYVYNSIHNLQLHSDNRVLTSSDIIARLPCLNHIEISFCDTFSDETLRMIAEQLTQIQHLQLVHCSGVTDLSPIYQLKRLNHLEIKECKNIRTVGQSNETLSVQKLYIANCNNTVDRTFLEHMIRLSSATIQEISIERMNNIQTITIPNCRNLQMLSFKRCSTFSKLEFEWNDSDNETITELNLSHTSITDDSLGNLYRFVALKDLHLEGCKMLQCPTITCNSVQNIRLDFCTNLVRAKFDRCVSLTYLCLNYTKVNDHALDLLFRELPGLKNLECKNCKELKRPKISCYDSYSICGRSQLECIDMQACSNMTALQMTSSSSPMKQIILNWTKVSDPVIEHITRNCPELETLELRTCDNIVSPTIIHSNLRTIDFSGNHSLLSPVLKCEKLETVNMCNCHNADEDESLLIESKVPVTPTRRRKDEKKHDETPASPPGANATRTPPSDEADPSVAPRVGARRRLQF
jgi:hypothetical protein